ncbi:hypothetical protein AAFF_G00003460 [Aldrovandia affinis]|uniref:Uncharacterized protein n=1 Tax=Aldrovandia affinis TaxID=143900 RepID=A0AAD7TD99_9TELE|nr:hypothetical protein AAFF_G00003460 [Aldrovandia affinis]
MGPAREEPNHDPQSARVGRVKNAQRSITTGRGRPRRRGSMCEERKREGSVKDKQAKPGWDVKAPPPFPPPTVSLKSLTDAEAKLAFGDELDAAQTHAKSPASSVSQLMCQASEIVGPPSGPNLSFLPQIDEWLHVALQDADSYYRLKKYVIAARRFTTALELCSKGAVLGKDLHADYEDISKVIGFIESKLVACYLRMRRPDLALNHSHRSIYLNPVHYQNHFRQAVVQRLLGQPREAAR